VGEPGAYRLAQALPTIQMPASVHAVLAARIDRLPPEEKRLLQTAAVVGTEVPLPLLRAIADMPEAVLHRGVAHLQAAEFLYEMRLFPEQVYTFKHALTHEVAYSSLLQERRRALHAQIVEVLETMAGERSDEQADRLAQHALRGQVWVKALRYCRQAGVRAFAASAYREAVGYWEQALEALAHLPPDHTTREQAVDLRGHLYQALIPFGQWEQILTHLRDAETLAAGLADHCRLGAVYRRMANTLRAMQSYEPALAYCKRAHAMATGLGDVDLQVGVTHQMGQLYRELGDYRQAMECFQQTLTAFQGERRSQSFGSLLPSVQARVQMVYCLSELGGFADGVAYGDEAHQIAEVVNHPFERLHVYYGVGSLHLRQGTLHTAIPLLERTLAYALASRATDAPAMLGRAEGNPAIRAEAYLHAGDVEEAHRLAQRELTNARHRTRRSQEARVLWLLGEIAMRRGPSDVEHAETHYQPALVLAEALGMHPLQAHCRLGLGRLYCEMGRCEPARAALSAAIELYRAMEMIFWLPQAEAALAQVEGR
jgi:tetratricopeptide (TPR) repeat protein